MTVPSTLRHTFPMNNGVGIPCLGLGVYRMAPGSETQSAVREALTLGYRHIDTARVYGNEEDVGTAIAASGIPRDRIFVTTKVWNADQGYDETIRACRESLQMMGLARLDLLLLHWPVEGKRLDSWRALVQLQKDGLCRSIGVSNFMVRHLEELLDASSVVPQVNQIEVSPYLQQRDVRAFCAQHGIVVEAYSPLTKGRRLGARPVEEVAKRHGRTPAQVLLRWCLEENMVVLVKSSRKSHLEENASIFDFQLTAEDKEQLGRLEEGLHTGWDPTSAP